MNLSEKKTDGIVVPLMFILTGLSLISLNLFNRFTGISLYINIIICIIVVCANKKVREKNIIAISFFVFFALITLMIHNGGFGSILTFIVPLIYISAFCDAKISKSCLNYIKLICICIVLYEFIYSFNYHGVFVYYIRGKINPNTIGVYSMYAFLYYTALSSQESKKNKVAFAVLFGISCLTMINCESRMSLVSLIFGVLLMSLKITKGRFYTITSYMLIVVGTIFPHIYVKMYTNGVDLQLLGKSLYTGREDIWVNMEENLKDNVMAMLFGLGSKSNLFLNHDLNMHNNYLGIIVNFGFIGYVTCFFYILHFIRCGSKYVNNSAHRKMLILFITTVLFYGFTETSYLWSSVMLFSFLCLGLSCNKSVFELET